MGNEARTGTEVLLNLLVTGQSDDMMRNATWTLAVLAGHTHAANTSEEWEQVSVSSNKLAMLMQSAQDPVLLANICTAVSYVFPPFKPSAPVINKLIELAGSAIEMVGDGGGGEGKAGGAVEDNEGRDQAMHVAHTALRALLAILQNQDGVLHEFLVKTNLPHLLQHMLTGTDDASIQVREKRTEHRVKRRERGGEESGEEGPAIQERREKENGESSPVHSGLCFEYSRMVVLCLHAWQLTALRTNTRCQQSHRTLPRTSSPRSLKIRP